MKLEVQLSGSHGSQLRGSVLRPRQGDGNRIVYVPGTVEYRELPPAPPTPPAQRPKSAGPRPAVFDRLSTVRPGSAVQARRQPPEPAKPALESESEADYVGRRMLEAPPRQRPRSARGPRTALEARQPRTPARVGSDEARRAVRAAARVAVLAQDDGGAAPASVFAEAVGGSGTGSLLAFQRAVAAAQRAGPRTWPADRCEWVLAQLMDDGGDGTGAWGGRAGVDESTFVQGCKYICLLYTSPSPRDRQKSRMPSSA